MVLQESFGVDLGSDTIKIYSLKKDEVLIEKNMIAVRKQDQIFSLGNAAYDIFEKTPKNIQVLSPVVEGMIANIGLLEVVLHHLLRKINKHYARRPIVYFSVPVNMTEIEKRAYKSLASGGDLHNSKVFLVEKPILNALAIGIPLSRSKGSMIVDMGDQCCDFSIIADNRVIINKTLSKGGNSMDDAIIANVRKRCNLTIGKRTASRLKAALAGFSEDNNSARKVFGIDTVSGLPREGVVTSGIVKEAVSSVFHQICEELKSFLDRLPPQIKTNVYREGIFLVGGCSRIENSSAYMTKESGCMVQNAKYNELSVIYGLKEVMSHPSLQHWAHTAKTKSKKYHL